MIQTQDFIVYNEKLKDEPIVLPIKAGTFKSVKDFTSYIYSHAEKEDQVFYKENPYEVQSQFSRLLSKVNEKSHSYKNWRIYTQEKFNSFNQEMT